MRFVIVTGMSGAGKSTALKILEDFGYYCVDNLPVELFLPLARLSFERADRIRQVALGIDVRNGEPLGKLTEYMADPFFADHHPEILFLNASDECLIHRYKESRRSHPLSDGGSIEKGIDREREKLSFLMEGATYIVDTTSLLTRELRQWMSERFLAEDACAKLSVKIMSFGFKHGIPIEADLVMDVRFLPNPFYIEALRPKTGNDSEVFDYVMSFEDSRL